MIYAVAALVVTPWVVAFVVSPNVLSVLHQTKWETLFWCYVFGAMWGVGGLTWGLMIRYLGVGLGLAVGCGVCASVGTLAPPIFRGELPSLAGQDWGIATLAGIGIGVLGIILTGAAGMSKERELSDEQKKAAVAEFHFSRGIVVALFSGVMSAGMAFGLGAGNEIERATLHTQPATDPTWQGIPVLVVVLLGGFTVNLVWCLFLNYENRSAGDYTKAGAPLAANVLFASVAGVIWYSQFAIYKVADAKSGELSFAGWTVLMCSMVIFSTLLGILMREWKGVSVRTTSLLAASLVVLVLALVAIGYGNYLKPSVTDGTIAKVDAATLVVHTADDTEQTFPLDAKTIILLGDQQGDHGRLEGWADGHGDQVAHGPVDDSRSALPRHVQESRIGFVPGCRVPRFVLFHLETAANDLAGLGDRAHVAGRNRLHHEVADGRGLDRPGHNAASAGVGRGLAELAVARAAAHDVDGFDPPADERFAHPQRLAKLHGDAFQPTAEDRASSPGTAWPVCSQKRRMASGMLSGARNSAASGLMNETSGRAAAASWFRSSHCQFFPSWFHLRRHS